MADCPDCGKILYGRQCSGCGFTPAELRPEADPTRTKKMPLCYGCGVAIDAPGMCARCDAAHLQKLQAMLARVKAQPRRKNDSLDARAVTKKALTDAQKAQLAQEHAHVRAHYRTPDDVPF